jgi:hypothetical protein
MARNPNRPNTTKPPHSMVTAKRRQRIKINKDSAHHNANQNTGCVIADNNFESTNILSIPIFLR